MKHGIFGFLVSAALFLASPVALAATQKEQAFLDSYKRALESNDTKTLESFLYVKDADPAALEFFKSSLPLEEGFKVAKLELVDVSPAEVAQAVKPMPGPDGSLSALPLKPTKKFIIEVRSEADENQFITTQRAVGEVDGAYRILVPAVIKK